MKLRCPVCHASNSLEAFIASEAGRELLVLLAQSGPLFRPMVAYLGCFRPPNRDLSHQRALKLAKEVLALGIEPARLVVALDETTNALRQKRENGGKPLTNHNYLKRVAENTASAPASSVTEQATQAGAPTGKRAQGLALLHQWGQGDWLRGELADGLAALLTLGLDGAPAADIVCRTADIWRLVVEKAGCAIEQVDRTRVQKAFTALLRQPHKRWPDPAALVARLPRRPERQKLPDPAGSDAERAEGLKQLRDLQAKLAKGMTP